MAKRLLTIVISFLLLYSTLNQCQESYASAPEDFIASMDWSDSTVGTPLDVSSLVLDAPAGKHGFVQVKDGHFYFQDGARAKFWGANLGLYGNFPSHRDADNMAKKLAALGFNAVRIHSIDNDNNSQSTIIDRTLNHTQTLNPDTLDKLDYLVSVLKNKGIYIVMEVQAARRLKSGDGVNDYDKLLNRSAKVVDYFDEHIIQIEKDYASKLFGHVNPYTGLAYKDDPVLALVGMTNEDYLFNGWIDGSFNGVSTTARNLPPYYLSKLDTKFNQFLKDKYGTQEDLAKAWVTPVRANLLTNGDFETSYSDDWFISTKGDLKTTVIQSTDNPHGGSFDLKFSQTLPTIHSSYSDLVMKQLGIKLQKGHTYKLEFYGKSKNAGISTLKVRFENDGYLKQSYGLDANSILDHDQDWKYYTKTFVAAEDTMNDSQASLSFNCGWCWGEIELDDIRLTEVQLPAFADGESLDQGNISRTSWADRFMYSPQRLADVSEFYYSILTSYFINMEDHLKNTVGLQVPISTSNNYTTNAEIMARTAGDYMDAHVYWDHPMFPTGKEWSLEDFAQTNESLIATAGNQVNRRYFSRWIELLALNRVEGKPFVVGEWQHVFPNNYEFEGTPLLTAYALHQDWDALFIYNYSGTNDYTGNAGRIAYWFDIVGNPSKLAQMPIYSLSFLKGYVKPATHTLNIKYENQEVLSSTIVNGNNLDYNIKGGLPTALLYTHKVTKSFDAPETSVSTDKISEAENQSLSAETVHRSDTGELVWDVSVRGSETFAINTPKSQSITGFITNKSLGTNDMNISLNAQTYPYGSVALQPLDDKPIVDSSNMLLTLISKQYNTGQEKNEKNGLSNWGKGPTMMQPLTGKVQINMNLDGVSTVQVYQLSVDGKQSSKLPVEVDRINDKVTIRIDSLSSPYVQVVKIGK